MERWTPSSIERGLWSAASTNAGVIICVIAFSTERKKEKNNKYLVNSDIETHCMPCIENNHSIYIF